MSKKINAADSWGLAPPDLTGGAKPPLMQKAERERAALHREGASNATPQYTVEEAPASQPQPSTPAVRVDRLGGISLVEPDSRFEGVSCERDAEEVAREIEQARTDRARRIAEQQQRAAERTRAERDAEARARAEAAVRAEMAQEAAAEFERRVCAKLAEQR